MTLEASPFLSELVLDLTSLYLRELESAGLSVSEDFNSFNNRLEAVSGLGPSAPNNFFLSNYSDDKIASGELSYA
mgnify:FL=1